MIRQRKDMKTIDFTTQKDILNDASAYRLRFIRYIFLKASHEGGIIKYTYQLYFLG